MLNLHGENQKGKAGFNKYDMQKEALGLMLNKNIDALMAFMNQHPNDDFDKSKRPDKWTTGQHIEHLRKSIKMLNKALRIPLFILGWRFGKCNREERTYYGLYDRYKTRLEGMTISFGLTKPGPIDNNQKVELLKRLKREYEVLVQKITKISERDLSKYILPHPLLGKLTIREMIYFTSFHTDHHHRILEKYY